MICSYTLSTGPTDQSITWDMIFKASLFQNVSPDLTYHRRRLDPIFVVQIPNVTITVHQSVPDLQRMSERIIFIDAAQINIS